VAGLLDGLVQPTQPPMRQGEQAAARHVARGVGEDGAEGAFGQGRPIDGQRRAAGLLQHVELVVLEGELAGEQVGGG
jgi:hypothetical protein